MAVYRARRGRECVWLEAEPRRSGDRDMIMFYTKSRGIEKIMLQILAPEHSVSAEGNFL